MTRSHKLTLDQKKEEILECPSEAGNCRPHHIQVLDVGINKPFKNALGKASRQWMIDNPPTTKRGRPEIARTLIEAWESPDIVSSVSIQITFRKIGYEFY